jgi:hypothetical protein
VTHGVNPAMKEVETPDTEAVLDGVAVETDGEQLRLSYDPVLWSRQPGDQNVGCGQFG